MSIVVYLTGERERETDEHSCVFKQRERERAEQKVKQREEVSWPYFVHP